MFSPYSEKPAWSREFAWADRGLGAGLGTLLLGRGLFVELQTKPVPVACVKI